MSYRNIEIIDVRSWSVNIKSRKGLGSFQIPIDIVEKNKYKNGDIVSVIFQQSNGLNLSFPERLLTSGCEILLPKKDQNRLNRFLPLTIRINPNNFADYNDVDEDEGIYVEHYEGKEKIVIHRLKERSKDVVKDAKQIWKKLDPLLQCSVCKFSFVETYGPLGENFIEAHHILPLHFLSQETMVTPKDLAPVCSNCHRMLHGKLKNLTIEELRKTLKIHSK